MLAVDVKFEAHTQKKELRKLNFSIIIITARTRSLKNLKPHHTFIRTPFAFVSSTLSASFTVRCHISAKTTTTMVWGARKTISHEFFMRNWFPCIFESSPRDWTLLLCSTQQFFIYFSYWEQKSCGTLFRLHMRRPQQEMKELNVCAAGWNGRN